MEIVLNVKPPQFDAVKFEGGLESATKTIAWFKERGVIAFYAPEEEMVVIHEVRGGSRFFPANHWIIDRWDNMGDTMMSRFARRNDEDLAAEYTLADV